MKTEKHKLTNLIISNQYRESSFHLMIGDFVGAFACWIIRQDESNSYHLSSKAIEAYANHLRIIFPEKDTVVKLDYFQIEKLTSSWTFEEIQEVLAMNQLGKGFVDLGALSRNVFFHIMREQITQPLG